MSKFRTGVFSFATALSLAILSVAANCDPALAERQRPNLTVPAMRQAPAAAVAQPYQANRLVIMLDPKADKGEIVTALREAEGTVEKTLNFEGVQVLLVRTEPGKMEAAERKLSKDRAHFSRVARNYIYDSSTTLVNTGPNLLGFPNDPSFDDQWNLVALNVPEAWKTSTGTGVNIGLLDSGSQGSIVELAGKVNPGLDANDGGAANVDKLAKDAAGNLVPHGTLMSSVMAANTDNNVGIAGLARDSKITPYRIMDDNGNPDLFNILAGISDACQKKVRILVLPVAAKNVAQSLGNTNDPASALVQLFAYVHHVRYNGLIFLPTGNNKQNDTNDRAKVSWMYFVTSIDPNFDFSSSFANSGNITSFVAPGSAIPAINKAGQVKIGFGTSYSCSEVGAVAALCMAKHPAWTNDKIIAVLKQTAINSPILPNPNPFFGFGLPDADAAVRHQ